jgi:hypothetical protein
VTRLIALSCPLCAGAVAPPVDSRLVRCEYCNRGLHYCGDDFVPRLALAPALSKEALQHTFFETLSLPMVPADLRREAVVLQKRRLYFPLYLLTGTRGEVLHTVKERVVYEKKRDLHTWQDAGMPKTPGLGAFEASRSRVEATPDTRVLLGDFQYVYSGAAAEEWDFDSTIIQDLAAKHLDALAPAVLSDLTKLGQVLEATIPVERAIERGVAAVQGGAGGTRGILETSVRIVYFPLVEVVFRYGEQIHRILFDEVQGIPLCGRLPFRRGLAFAAAIPVTGILGLILGKGVKALLFDSLWQTSAARDAGEIWAWFLVLMFILFGMGLEVLRLLLKKPIDVELMSGGGAKFTTPEGGMGSLLSLSLAILEMIASVGRAGWKK